MKNILTHILILTMVTSCISVRHLTKEDKRFVEIISITAKSNPIKVHKRLNGNVIVEYTNEKYLFHNGYVLVVYVKENNEWIKY